MTDNTASAGPITRSQLQIQMYDAASKLVGHLRQAAQGANLNLGPITLKDGGHQNDERDDHDGGNYSSTLFLDNNTWLNKIATVILQKGAGFVFEMDDLEEQKIRTHLFLDQLNRHANFLIRGYGTIYLEPSPLQDALIERRQKHFNATGEQIDVDPDLIENAMRDTMDKLDEQVRALALALSPNQADAVIRTDARAVGEAIEIANPADRLEKRRGEQSWIGGPKP